MNDTTDFRTQGFLVVPQLISVEEVTRLLSAIDRSEIGVMRSRGVRNLVSKVPAIGSLARSNPVRAFVSQILGPSHRLVRSILFDKVEGANWSLRWHQDVTVAVAHRLDVGGYGPWSTKDGVPSVQPPAAVLERMVSVRMHLDDCFADNGALQVIPGSHLFGKLDADHRAELIRTQPSHLCETGAGGALLMRPLLLHCSAASAAPTHRRVIHLDFAAGELAGGLEWAAGA